MYTVLRFTREPADVELFDAIGQMLNQVRPGIYTGIRRAGDGFVSVVLRR